jgi:uncharacterized protein
MFQGYRYIDSDAHVLEPDTIWENYLDPEYRDQAPLSRTGYRGDPMAFRFECWVDGVGMPDFLVGDSFLAADDVPFPGLAEVYAEFNERGFGPDVYIDVLDRSGIDYMVLYHTIGLLTTAVPTLDAPRAAAYRRAYNRWLAEFVADGGERLVGIGAVDLRDPVEAAREARVCVEKYGFKGIVINPDPVTPYPLFDAFHDPLWQTLQDLDVPLAIHPGGGTPINVGVDRYAKWMLGRGSSAFVMGNMLASMALIGGGVLERFPRLRVVHLEIGCGWVPYWLDRMQSGIQGSNRSEDRFVAIEGLSLSPIDFFRRQCFVASDPDDPHIAHVIAEVGEECIVTATDFGHPEGRGFVNAIAETLALEGVSDSSKRKIMWDNPARLYGIG